MLNKRRLQSILPVGRLGDVFRYYNRIGSTNEVALEMAQTGAQDGTLVIADEQTAGRGRAGRTWSTPAGSAVAMSLVLKPENLAAKSAGELTVMGALAVVEALEAHGVAAKIKWPNDVLLSGGKAAGVLVENGWMEDKLLYTVMGIGINVHAASIQNLEQFDFPAACLEDELTERVDRTELIKDVLTVLDERYAQLGSGSHMTAWNDKMAYRGESVTVQGAGMNSTGKLVGVSENGQLRLQLVTGEVLQIGVGGHNLRPVDKI